MASETQSFRERVRKIIFEADTPAGKFFDVCLIVCIVLSLTAVIFSSVEAVYAEWGKQLIFIEWFFTIVFTIEYALRLWSVQSPLRYAISFFGIIDLLAIVPTYLSLFLTDAEFLIVIRAIRTLRIFRILKLFEYVNGANTIIRALTASRAKITVFILGVVILVIIIGAIMYLVEGEENGFTSIPVSIYWAIVTLTTTGYGDIAPQTPLGQIITSFVMLTGYAIIAVPTGIVTAELTRAQKKVSRTNTIACKNCTAEGHADDAVYCRKCAHPLHDPQT